MIMTTSAVANKLVGYCKQGQFAEAIGTLYSDDIVSIEPNGDPVKEVRGLEAVKQKTADFNNMVEAVHGNKVSEPIVGDNYFECTMTMELTFKGAPRSTREEVCLYQVNNGKLTRKEFLFYPHVPRLKTIKKPLAFKKTGRYYPPKKVSNSFKVSVEV